MDTKKRSNPMEELAAAKQAAKAQLQNLSLDQLAQVSGGGKYDIDFCLYCGAKVVSGHCTNCGARFLT